MNATKAAAWASLVGCVILAGCRCNADPTAATSGASPTRPAEIEAWPSAERVLCVDLNPGGAELVAGVSGNNLWIGEAATGGARVRFRSSFDAPVELVTAGDYGRGARLYVARGSPSSKGPSPLVLDEIDVESGAVIELFRAEVVRPEAVELEIADVDRDKSADLAFAFYATKNQVKTHHLLADGRFVEGALDRTAQARTFADLDGDGVADAIVGRLYGEGDGATSGDLRVDLGHGPVSIPTEGGVRAVATARGPDKKTVLYFADGWSSAYLKEGRARIKRARWNGHDFDVETVGSSPDEYTFFSLAAFARPDGVAVVGAGNARVTLFDAGPPPRPPISLGGLGKGVTAACRDGKGSFSVWSPGPTVTALGPPG